MLTGYTNSRTGLIFAIVLAAHLLVAAGVYTTFKLRHRVPAEPPAEESAEAPSETNDSAGPSTPEQRPPSDPQVTTYTVKPGDTYWDIAMKYGLTVKQLKAYNGHADDRMLRAHETLRIPPIER